MATLYEELSRVATYDYTEEDVREFESLHAEIRALKAQRNAVIVAHNYYRPEILKVADFVGDSLELALMASKVKDADVIDFCGVHFMAETAKILNPTRTVLLPNLLAGCQLADSAPAEDLKARIEELRKQYPDLAVVSYVNTTAAVKALSDIICTSANAAKVVRSLPNENILFVPDRNLANHVAQQVPEKNVIPWEGFCYVHQQITPEEVSRIRENDPELEILVHPECRPDVAKLADAVLSTSGMVKYAKERPAKRFLVVTECGLSDRLAMEVPDKTFVKGCKLCTFMKVTSLEDVRDSLRDMKYEIDVPEDVRVPAERALRRMFEVTEGKPGKTNC
ncbi:MAG TPA: quinolinate synthase NadA [Thermoanaerobaculia bacterium]|jgi:quinolinate synthase|nr:quinolinate synthase NadA [Thermoanaerobaculia bacterium]